MAMDGREKRWPKAKCSTIWSPERSKDASLKTVHSKNSDRNMYTKLRVIFALQLCIFARPVWSTEDYCAKNPCITKDPHAKCTNGSAGPKCVCSSPKYSGSLCEKMSACSANPCNQKDANAKCSEVTGGGYTCACSSKQYSGKNCEKSWTK